MRTALIQTHVAYHPEGVGREEYARTDIPGTGYMIYGPQDVVAKIVEFANLHAGRPIAHEIKEEDARALLLQAAE